MKKIAYVLIALLPTWGPVFAEVSLKEAVKKGIAMNMEYRNSWLQTDSREILKSGAEAEKLFSVDASASYVYRSQQMEIDFPDMEPAPGIVIPGMSVTAGAKHNYDVKLSLTQPLFTGGILRDKVRLQEVALESELHALAAAKIEAAAKVKQSYFTYRLLTGRLAVLDTLLERMRLHYGKLENFYREELVKQSDLLETEASILEQELNRRDLLRLLEEERIHFKALCGLDIEEIEKDYDENDCNFEEAFREFRTHHPIVKTLEQQEKALQIRRGMIAAAYLPRVGGFAEFHYGKPGIDFFKNEWSSYFQGGLSMEMKVFDWHKKKRDIQVVDFEREKLKNRKTDFIAQGKKGLEQLFAARQAGLDNLQTVQKLVRIAARDSALKEELVRERQIPNIDYLSALTQETRYRSMEKIIGAQLELIKVNIRRLTGKIEEAE